MIISSDLGGVVGLLGLGKYVGFVNMLKEQTLIA